MIRLLISISLFLSACNLHPKEHREADAKLSNADALLAEKKYEESLVIYKNSYEQDSSNLKAIYGYALSNLKLGNNLQAIFYFNKYLAKVHSVDAYGYRGLAYDNLDSTQQALRDYSIAIELDSSIASVYNNRGLLKNKLKLYDEAMKDLAIALKIDSNQPECYNNIGLVYSDLGNENEAIRYYSKAILMDSSDGTSYYNRGVCYINAENYAKAIEDLNKAITLNPTNGLFYKNRAIAYYRLKDLDKTCEDLNKAVQFKDESSKEYLEKFCGQGVKGRKAI